MTRLRTVVLVTLFALATSTLHLQAAATYSEKGFYCISSPTATSAGQLTVHFPSLTSTSYATEYVFFTALVYRYNSTKVAWEPYAYLPYPSAMPAYPNTWYVGMANSNGPVSYGYYGSMLMYWKNGFYGTYAANASINLPKGYYSVREFYRWQSGTTGSTWATLVQPGPAPVIPVGTKGGYCVL
jgi:hypothetical protein